jgi:hypothetical protein
MRHKLADKLLTVVALIVIGYLVTSPFIVAGFCIWSWLHG